LFRLLCLLSLAALLSACEEFSMPLAGGGTYSPADDHDRGSSY
jgi:hypothetical protein